MSIKIEGRGSNENVFSDSDSGMPLWNGKPLLNLVYPVGSIYWSSNNTNPGTLFGGTWTQIKDKFILAAGDSYSNGATGGAATVTLTVSNMPSHTHSFTPSGAVSSHSHSFTPSGAVSSHSHSFTPSGKVGSHTHTGPSHRHSFTPSGTVASHSHIVQATENGAAVDVSFYTDSQNGIDSLVSIGNISDGGENETGWLTTNSVQPSFSGTAGTTGAAGTGNTGSTSPSFTGTAGTTSATTPSFTGTAGTTSATTPSFTGTAGTTGSSGSGSSFSILPPYVVKYCWERIA